jgi:methyl-accepting chemotaxis protein
MRWFYNLKISAKLIIGFLFVAVIAGVVGDSLMDSFQNLQVYNSNGAEARLEQNKKIA